MEGEVKKLNLGLSKYQSFRDESYNISMVLSRVSNITPASISLSALNVDAGSKNNFIGQAQTREDIVVMENKIKNRNILKILIHL